MEIKKNITGELLNEILKDREHRYPLGNNVDLVITENVDYAMLLAIVDKICKGIFDEEGNYHPELKKPLLYYHIIYYMTNIDIPEQYDTLEAFKYVKSFNIIDLAMVEVPTLKILNELINITIDFWVKNISLTGHINTDEMKQVFDKLSEGLKGVNEENVLSEIIKQAIKENKNGSKKSRAS
jgi:hypothetical protein